MTVPVTRINVRLNPDYKKVIPRFFNTGIERSLLMLQKLLAMEAGTSQNLLNNLLQGFSDHYRDIKPVFLKHYGLIKSLISDSEQNALGEEKKLLIGAYFTMEYSIEAAALFNPSIVEDPDQSGAKPGEKKVIVSFRATGESHISSLVFKRALLDETAMIHFEPSGRFFSEGLLVEKKSDTRAAFGQTLSQIGLPDQMPVKILQQLPDHFSYKDVQQVLESVLRETESLTEKKKIRYDVLSLVNTSYELYFDPASLMSERVIFPVTQTEKNGIEDARFVRFTEDDGSIVYVATYTAYDGYFILPQLILTLDFRRFTIKTLSGTTAINKNLALFPRKINGKYAMISRIDNINNYIMFSDNLYVWDEAVILQRPKYPWEFIQIGNAGSPIETSAGWLLITHGVGAMRRYCLGASLFDLDDPTIELGRLEEPLLVPNEDERHGYVPNVVYSCGSMIHGDKLFIPYAVSDYASSFATVVLKDLIAEILRTTKA